MCIRDRDILERGNIVVIPQGVDTVIHGDIADTVSWEKVLNQMPGLQIIKMCIRDRPYHKTQHPR